MVQTRGSLRSRDGSCVFQLKPRVTSVGREGTDIILQLPNVEHQHATIEYDDNEGSFVLQDLNTAHGTYVNDCRVQNAAVRLAPGDVVRFGHGNDAYELVIDSNKLHYPPLPTPRTWEGSTIRVISTPQATQLPYLPLATPGEALPIPGGSSVSVLPGAANGEVAQNISRDSRGGNVLPHPPRRSRPASAGTGARPPRPQSAGRERSSSGAWLNGSFSELTAQELEQKLLRMGDEISRLAAFEAECHRKDGVISTLRDEMSEMRSNVMGDSGYDPADVEDLRAQICELQTSLRQKDEAERITARKLGLYQNQLHSKNEEVASLNDKLHTQQSNTGGWMKQDVSSSTTNVIAELRTELAERDRRIAHLANDLEKANKQKIQSTTLLNTVQRESAAKDVHVQQAKREVDKMKKEMREKNMQVTTLSTRLTKHKVTKDAEKECEKLEKEVLIVKGKLQQTERNLKERNTLVTQLQDQIDNLKVDVERASLSSQPDRSHLQELDYAKSQVFESQRQEKLLKVDLQQIQKKFDKFRRDVIQMTFSSGFKHPENKELNEDEIVNYIRLLSEDRDLLTRQLKHYEETETESDSRNQDIHESRETLQKAIEEIDEHLDEGGRSCASLNEELTVLEELEVEDNLEWIKSAFCNMLSNQVKWEQKIERALENAGQDLDSGDPAELINNIQEELERKTNKCDELQERITVQEETHQDKIEKLKQDYEEEYERKLTSVIDEVRAEEEEKRHEFSRDLRQKERNRIEAAVDMERKIFESQHGNLSQMQMVLSEKQTEVENLKSDLFTAKEKYEQTKEALQRSKQNEEHLHGQMEDQKLVYQNHVAKMELDKQDIHRQKEEEVASFKEQTRQHAVTIVAMEDRLLMLSKQNKHLEQELVTGRQHSAHKKIYSPSSRPLSSKKDSSRKEAPQTPVKETPVHSKPQMKSVTTETIPLNTSDSALRNDIYKLEQLVLLLRREASQAKKELVEKENVVLALRRDLAGASARLSDVAGELSDKQKEKLEEYKEKILKQDEELAEQRELLEQLSALVDQQKQQIGEKEGELEEQSKMVNVHRNKAVEKVKELTNVKKKLDNDKQEQLKELEKIEKENQTVGNLAKLGSKCRGERHELVIARQKEALSDLRQRAKTLEQFKPPLPSHEQTLQQVILLKKELSELRGAVAAKEDDFHKNESELHSELRMHREQAASVSTESSFEKSAHKQTKDALDRSERTFIKTVRTLAELLEVNSVPGCRPMADVPADERERVEKERDKALESLVRKIKLVFQRLNRKENLLGSYERDLTQLKEVESVAGHRTAQVASLSVDVRDRGDEVSYLRESVSRLRDELDQQKRLNMSLRERKQFAMDVKERESHGHVSHSCYKDEFSRHKEEKKQKRSAEKIKRKNYEIESLKRELQSADMELNDTAAKLASFEVSNSWRAHSPGKTVTTDTGIIEDIEDDDVTVDEEY